jgi:4-hydroxy-tetrahydrodipicolinate synthase
MSYDELRDSLRDIGITTTTPFTDDESAVRHDALATNLIELESRGGRVFFACGNTGEYYALTDEERAAVVETHVEAVDSKCTVIGGAGGPTKQALSLIADYEAAGADAVLVMHPSFTYAHETGLRSYYRRLAESTDLGIVIYKRGSMIPDRVVADLTTIDNVVAVKYAVNDVASFSQLVDDASGDVTWINGLAERYALAFHAEGARGFTTGIGNFAPEQSLALHERLQAGDYDGAREIRDRLRPYENLRTKPGVNNELSDANNVPAIKYGQELAGLVGGPCRDPLVGLSDDDAARAEEYYSLAVGADR